MGRAAEGTAAGALAATARDDLEYGERLKLQLAVLREAFPGWEIWYVLLYPIGARWCARPAGCQDYRQTVHADSPEDLAGTIGDVIAGGVP
jgi:hypothetical protein